jgi:purine-binding chemotaxis protein CheW
MSARATLCTFRLDGHWMGIDAASVQEVLRHHPVTALRWAHAAVQGLLNLRGQIVTVVELRSVLGFAPRPEGRVPTQVVVRIGGSAVSLWVDEVGDVLEIDAGRFERTPGTLARVNRDLLRGVYRLDDQLLLELDLPRVLGAVMN